VNAALWRVFRRPERPRPWQNGGNLPWDDPAFSERMLREHLDQTHGAASRTDGERALQLPWLWDKLGLQAGDAVLDVTCGPGLYAVALAGRGCRVTGVDFGPAAIAYARELALAHGVAELCTFVQQDVREMTVPQEAFDAALLLYGQLAVMERTEAAALLETIAAALKPGGRLVVELLDQDRVDKEDSTWWFTDDKGLWGERPFLHLGERYWLADEALSMERYHIVDLETGQLDEILLCDQTYGMDEMGEIFRTAGFAGVDIYPAWDGVSLYDAAEWIVYVAVK
jgi:SAM-dependent methyltransferase